MGAGFHGVDGQLVTVCCDYDDCLKEPGMVSEVKSQLSPLSRFIVEWLDP
ncbi:hypothetical protein [uncultured Corynebacterium sp.]|nr:hypothetical protein [uncultured Corynebacterium sp.]